MSVKCVAMMNNASGNEQGYWDKLAERGVCVYVCVQISGAAFNQCK
jgi:hypothetical protein